MVESLQINREMCRIQDQQSQSPRRTCLSSDSRLNLFSILSIFAYLYFAPTSYAHDHSHEHVHEHAAKTELHQPTTASGIPMKIEKTKEESLIPEANSIADVMV